MAFGDDEEILQDFLVEAGEIIEQLSEQLVELEQRPDDKDLLNAIFRGFHTVKGGAGFLQLNTMVDCCHVTENLFDILRNGDRDVTAELMDVVLQALDTVTQQFQQLQNGDTPEAADPQLIHHLELLVAGEDIGGAAEDIGEVSANSNDVAAPESAVELDTESNKEFSKEPASSSASKADFDMSDEEFEGFLDALDDSDSGSSQAASSDTASSSASDEITEDEFEALLDQLHGSGQAPAPAAASASDSPDAASSSSVASDSDEISENEFEALLDQLHGSGKSPGKSTTAEPVKAETTDSNGSSSADLISDDEFENLLDELHGKVLVQPKQVALSLKLKMLKIKRYLKKQAQSPLQALLHRQQKLPHRLPS